MCYLLSDDDDSLNLSRQGKSKDYEKPNPLLDRLRVLRKTRRISKFSLVTTFRAKYICIPNQVEIAVNHVIDTFWEGREFNVPTSIGMLHHYRRPCDGTEILDTLNHARTKDRTKDCVDEPSQVDRSIHRFKKKLLESVEIVLNDLSNQCNLNLKKIEVNNNIPLSFSD